MGGSNTLSNVAASPTALALIVAASAVTVSLALQHSTKKMPKSAAAAAEPPVPPPDLPNPNFATSTFENGRSQKLFALNLPQKHKNAPPRAMLFVVHGVAEHCCRQGYVGLYESLSEAGVDVYAYDHHGHGRSEGAPRGYCEKFEHYVTDLLDYIKLCQARYTDDDKRVPPLMLMGQSMGALICIMAALRLGSYHVAGLILTSPALGVDMNLMLKMQKFAAPAIDRFMPTANIVDVVRPEDMSRNKEAVKAYIEDPLVMHSKLVARTAIQTSKAFDTVKDRRGEITCPVLMLHGTEDRCTSIKASRDFFHNIGTDVARKRFLQLPGLYHELLEEPEVDQLMVSICGFAGSAGEEITEVDGEEEDGLVVVKLE
ncbi:hypothetical protein ACHAXT_008776 [Thalassiosira profunda]